MQSIKKQSGFIQGALLIGIALMAVVIGIFAVAGNSKPNQATVDANELKAAKAELIIPGVQFADAVGMSIGSSTETVASISANADGSIKLMNEAGSDVTNAKAVAILPHLPDNRQLGSSATDWELVNVGSSAFAVVTGLPASVCKAANKDILRTTTSLTALADLSDVPATWSKGCINDTIFAIRVI